MTGYAAQTILRFSSSVPTTSKTKPVDKHAVVLACTKLILFSFVFFKSPFQIPVQ